MKDETLTLASDCRKLLAARSGTSEDAVIDIYTPKIGVIVDASVDTNAWAVKLTDALVKRLKWQNVKGLSIATITARLEATMQDSLDLKQEGSNKKQKLLKGEAEEKETPTRESLDSASAEIEMPILDVLPSNLASATRSVAQPLQVGDLRLADLRKIMQSSGYTAEFKGEGTLLINGSVIVRKLGTGRIEVESVGLMTGLHQGATFYAVKSKIYEGLAVVAGG
jgi:cleavage and polyadenylation specificity factor subunit 2